MSDAPSVYPSLRYADAPAAIEFLTAAFGFETLVAYPGEEEGTIAHAELVHDNGIIMLGSQRAEADDIYRRPLGASLIYVAIDDTDAHHARAKAAGAEILREPTDQDYGSRDYAAKDPEGNIWSFGTYRPAPGDRHE